jgi:hypothetical protein
MTTLFVHYAIRRRTCHTARTVHAMMPVRDHKNHNHQRGNAVGTGVVPVRQ